MSAITWTHPFLYQLLQLIPINTNLLVDVGCGRGIIGALMRIYRKPNRLVAIDGFEPSLAFCKKHDFYDEYFKVDLSRLPLPFSDGEFEIATCIEVIEHLPKQAGFKLMDELERVARKVIVTTPKAFFNQDCYDGNPHQAHLSNWTIKEFADRGYEALSFESFGRFNVYPSYTDFLKSNFFKLASRILWGRPYNALIVAVKS